jgi:CHRD domain/Calx-beta domain/Subtilase family/Domain of unknown function (DUF4214)
MNKDKIMPSKTSTRRQIRRSRRPFFFTLILIASVVTLAVGSGLLPGSLSASRPDGTDSPGQQSISAEVLQQIQALEDEKDSRTPAQQKIDSQLLYAARMQRGEPVASGMSSLQVDVGANDQGRVVVDISAAVNDQLIQLLERNGAIVLASVPESHSVRVEIGIDRLETIAASDSVRFIQPKAEYALSQSSGPGAQRVDDVNGVSDFNTRAERVRKQLTNALTQKDDDKPADPAFATSVGLKQSEGDVSHRANTARGAFNVDGTGIKIGVLSNGVVSLASSQAAGDLGPVTILPGQTGTGDEGTAMLEIVHDLAPGAQLFFATANGGPAIFAQNIRNLRTAGCDIIVDDVFYFAETPFQDGQAPVVVSTSNGGLIAQAVSDVTAAGALYFSSAGNQGNKNDGTASCYQGDFVDGGANALLPGGTVHNFGGGNLNNQVLVASGNPTNLFWSDPLAGSTNDYDLFVLNAAATAIQQFSTNIQSGTQDPFEQVSATTATNRIVVFKKAGAQARFFYLTTNSNTSGGAKIAINTEGTTKGHSAIAAAFSVGATPVAMPAVPFTTIAVTETFSSDGPRRLFFAADGAAITPGNFSSTGGLVRQKPDITAADGVSVTGVGGFGTPFFGTSAAAPHAAAIAALIKQAKPALTTAQIRTALTSSALDIEAGGVDRDSGAGIVMAYQALQAAGATGAANLQTGTITMADVGGNGNGIIEPGEQGTLTVQLTNPEGANAATAISSTLTSATAGVSINQSASAYPDIAINAAANNTTPFAFSVSSAIPCQVINLTLTVNYTGGVSPKVFPISLNISRAITETLDATPPASGGTVYTSATGLQVGRITRNGVTASCPITKPFPGFQTLVGNRRFDSYTFANNTATDACVTVGLSGTGAINMFTAVYSNYSPTSLDINYMGDPGFSSDANTPYSFTVPAHTSFTVVVHEIDPAGAIGTVYTLKVDGLAPPCAAAAAVNQPPVNTVPGAQQVIENSQLVFTGGNAISIADPDAAANPISVTLGATSGTLTLSGIAGLTFSAGNGTNNTNMVFAGTVAAINAALNGLIYRPNVNFTGAANVNILTNDQGFLGAGGAKSDTDAVPITVQAGSSFNFNAANYIVGESDGSTIVTVTRNGDLSTAASVNYATSNGTANDRSDYGAAFGTLQFAAGQFSTTVPILINQDSLVEGTETFNLTLSNPQGTGVALGLQPTAVGTIIDNASEPATNAIDDTTNFVEQHYHDFLNREPDAPGLAFWVNNIESCGANAACREVKRIDTSAAFFLSIEFQQTGFLAYKTFAAAYGPTRVGSTVPLTSQEFLTDTQQLGSGVIIGNAGAEVQLEANKVGYFNQFVTRPEFVTKYPGGLTNEQYVDNLLASAGLSPSQVRLFAVNLTNSQEVPPTNPTTSTGGARPASFGTARLRFNDAQTAMTFTSTVSNIDFTGSQTSDTNDNLIAAHIHAGPTVAPGVNGPVVWGFFGTPFNDTNPNDQQVIPLAAGVGGINGKWDAPEGNGTTLAAQLTNLREGRAYVNFHTIQFGGGEIRGNIPPATAFRDALVAGLNASTETRATVLRKVAEAEELSLRESNRAFVLMQYFGYMRRNPNETPDADFCGYNFWLNKLNAANGDFRASEMVKAFISSSEYRKRFGLN